MSPSSLRPSSRLAALGLALLLAGCASLQPEARLALIQQQAKTLLDKDLQWPRDDTQRSAIDTRVNELLASELSADGAVQIALLNHRGLRAALHELGVADAELVQASLPPNPGFSLGRLRRGDETEIERGLHLDLIGWLTRGSRAGLAEQRLKQVQQDLTLQVLSVAAEARRSYYQAVATQEREHYERQALQAAEAGAELARRMAAAGNFNRLRQAREQTFYADAALALARSEGQRLASRESLIRALGLWGAQVEALHLPERLPELPAAARALPEVERQALQGRVDVQAARQATLLRAQELGLRRQTRFVNVLELGVLRNSSNEAPTQRGVELSLELPLFDWGVARVARAESLYMQAVERTAHVAIQARSEAREAYARYRLAFDVARHYRDELVPNRQRIADENLLRYNGMLIGVFELLADARAQVATVTAAIDARRDYFLAEAALDQALRGPAGPMAASSSNNAAPAAESGAGGH